MSKPGGAIGPNTKQDFIDGFNAGRELTQVQELVAENSRQWVDEFIKEGRVKLVHDWEFRPALGFTTRVMQGIEGFDDNAEAKG